MCGVRVPHCRIFFALRFKKLGVFTRRNLGCLHGFISDLKWSAGSIVMKNYNQDLQFDLIIPNLKATHPKQVLKTFAAEAARATGVCEERLYALMLRKEHQDSSGIGEGVAIPHMQVRGPRKSFTILARLSQSLDFDAADNELVDLACFVLSPESDGPYHLRRLARISRLLKNQALHSRLLDAQDTQSVNALLKDPEGWLLAA